MWILSAVSSAIFAGLTSIFAKCGIKKTSSNLATALRTIVVLVFSIIMVIIVGSYNTISTISVTSLIFLVLSGLSTGASWICYFKALSIGDVNKVVPIDKSSTVLTVLLAIICFGETNALAFKLIGAVVLAVGILLIQYIFNYHSSELPAISMLANTAIIHKRRIVLRQITKGVR